MEIALETAERGRVMLYAGIALSYTDITAERLPHRHEALEHVVQIDYCRAGQVVWDMGHGGRIFLNPGDFAVHTLGACADSVLLFPTGHYQGLTVSVDMREAEARPPEPVAGADVFGGLRRKLRPDGGAAFLAGNEQSEGIFSAFYGQPEALRLAYQRVKALELLLYLARVEAAPQLPEVKPEQIETVREIHNRLLQHIGQRVTIEELSRQYMMNPTTLKAAFKAVYGTSLAAHIKAHRMEQAARLLRDTDKSVAEIAQAVGYDSPSKFSAAFKASFQVLPREYRKRHGF